MVARLDDGLEPYLPPHKRSYAFACLAPAAARYAVWLLPDIAALNPLGVQRMCRMLASLQPALGGLGGGGGAGSFRPEAVRQFDRVGARVLASGWVAHACLAAGPHELALPSQATPPPLPSPPTRPPTHLTHAGQAVLHATNI